MLDTRHRDSYQPGQHYDPAIAVTKAPSFLCLASQHTAGLLVAKTHATRKDLWIEKKPSFHLLGHCDRNKKRNTKFNVFRDRSGDLKNVKVQKKLQEGLPSVLLSVLLSCRRRWSGAGS